MSGIPGNLGVLREQARALQDAGRAARAAPESVEDARGTVRAGWNVGPAAEAFDGSATRTRTRSLLER